MSKRTPSQIPDDNDPAGGEPNKNAERHDTATDATVPLPAVSHVQPTEQIAFDPSPVRASAAASGGATGLGDLTRDDRDGNGRNAPSGPSDPSDPDSPNESSTRPQPGLIRRHPLASGIVGGLIVAVVASGLTAWGVSSAVTSSLTNADTGVAPASGATSTPAAGAATGGGTGTGAGAGAGGAAIAGARVAFRATIQSITPAGSSGSASDSTWTILTRKGTTVTIAIDGATQFGTKQAPEDVSSFAVGSEVVIVAAKSDGAVTATRVVAASAIGSSGGLGA